MISNKSTSHWEGAIPQRVDYLFSTIMPSLSMIWTIVIRTNKNKTILFRAIKALESALGCIDSLHQI